VTHLQAVYLYDDPDTAGLDIDYLAGYLATEAPGLQVGVRTDFLTHHFGRFPEEHRAALERELERQLAGTRAAAHLDADEEGLPWAQADLDDVYVARLLQAALRLLIPEDEASTDRLHCVFMSQLLADIDAPADPRIGVAALGSPTLISTSGLVEAPRRPREYYFRRDHYAMLGAVEHIDALVEQFADRTVDYGDPRINELLKGYLLMAVVYRATGDGPCADPLCPLHAADTQQELLQSQLGDRSRICGYHRGILDTVYEE